KKAQNVAESGKPSVILFKHHASLLSFVETILNFQSPQPQNEKPDPRKYGQPLNDFCKENNHSVRFLGNSIGSFSESNERAMIYLMTCHSAKGLDFENVFIPMCEGFEKGEKLFYVALSRSRRRLFLSGKQCAWIHERLANNTSVTMLNASDVEEDENLF
ncbi:MAG: ATP-binding domain-containing protein, partial [Kiritimatiellae bacterium]|nr:ATP-binding domain-containing protein [Kiritimatiellia bacterium]